MHVANAPPSMLHANVDPATDDVNSKLTLALRLVVFTVRFGVAVSVVSGAGGLCWVYVADVLEQAEVPTALVAFAWNVVVLPTATVTASPGEAKAAALPVAAAVPEQSAVG